jgi:hypothetical protein
MNNYERLCSGVAEMADFILQHTTCFICPVDRCGGLSMCEDCEGAVTAWLMEEAEE